MPYRTLVPTELPTSSDENNTYVPPRLPTISGEHKK